MTFITDKLESFKADKDFSPDYSVKSFKFDFDVSDVMRNLRSKIIGQDRALDEIELIMKIIKAELTPPQKPLRVALLLGPTGVGKSETARLLASSLTKNDNFCCINMNTLAQEHYASSIVGSPPGYVGSKEGNTLFNADLIAGSYSCPSVVLFDELEKASSEVLLSLLDILDRGELTLASNAKKIDFKNSIIFMTSNLDSQKILGRKLSPKKEKKLILKSLERRFLPEFINRIDNVIFYSTLHKPQIHKIVELELAQIQSQTNHQIELSTKVKDFLVRQYNNAYGVRDVKRILSKEILPLVADNVISGKSSSFINLQGKRLLTGK